MLYKIVTFTIFTRKLVEKGLKSFGANLNFIFYLKETWNFSCLEICQDTSRKETSFYTLIKVCFFRRILFKRYIPSGGEVMGFSLGLDRTITIGLLQIRYITTTYVNVINYPLDICTKTDLRMTIYQVQFSLLYILS